MTKEEILARKLHQDRQREGHKTPDWEGLSDIMKQELIYQAKKKLENE